MPALESFLTLEFSLARRLEAGDSNRAIVIAGNEFIRATANDGRHMTRANERIQLHVWRVEDRTDRGRDRDVIAEDGEIVDAKRLRMD